MASGLCHTKGNRIKKFQVLTVPGVLKFMLPIIYFYGKKDGAAVCLGYSMKN